MRQPATGHRATVHPIRQQRSSELLGFPETLETLERRLYDGYTRIELARARGENVDAWEDFWIDLLHRYEAAHDALPEAA